MSSSLTSPTMKPFVLRSPNGPSKGRYFVSGDFTGIVWADDLERATRVSVEDAYGYVAAALDMLQEVLVPENINGTDADCDRFGEMAANDMLQHPAHETIDLFKRCCVRRSPAEPLHDLPDDFPKRDGYMSVWEWMARAFYRGST